MNNYAETLESYIITQEDMEYASEGVLGTIKNGIIGFFKLIIEKIGNLIQNIGNLIGIIRDKMKRKGKGKSGSDNSDDAVSDDNDSVNSSSTSDNEPVLSLPSKADVDSGNLPAATKGGTVSNTGATAVRTTGSTAAKQAKQTRQANSSNNSNTSPSRTRTSSSSARPAAKKPDAKMDATVKSAIMYFNNGGGIVIQNIKQMEEMVLKAVNGNDTSSHTANKMSVNSGKYSDLGKALQTHIDNLSNLHNVTKYGVKASLYGVMQRTYGTLSSGLKSAQGTLKNAMNRYSSKLRSAQNNSTNSDTANNTMTGWISKFEENVNNYIRDTSLFLKLGVLLVNKTEIMQ